MCLAIAGRSSEDVPIAIDGARGAAMSEPSSINRRTLRCAAQLRGFYTAPNRVPREALPLA